MASSLGRLQQGLKSSSGRSAAVALPNASSTCWLAPLALDLWCKTDRGGRGGPPAEEAAGDPEASEEQGAPRGNLQGLKDYIEEYTLENYPARGRYMTIVLVQTFDLDKFRGALFELNYKCFKSPSKVSAFSS